MLLEIIRFIFGATWHTARVATRRDPSRPRWLNHFLAGCYYLLPLMLIVAFLISWKMAVAVAAVLLVSLVVGAFTEGDDQNPQWIR